MKNELTIAGWVKATFIGWLLGILAVLALSICFDSLGIEGLQFFMGIGMGAGVGYMQWRVLRRKINMNSKWLWYSITGMGAPFLLFDLLRHYGYIPTGSYYIILSIAVSGLFTGVLQSIVLRKNSNRSPLWIMSSFAGWLLATLSFFSIDYTMKLIKNNWLGFSINLFIMLASGLVLGLVTGIFLVRIMRQKPAPVHTAAAITQRTKDNS